MTNKKPIQVCLIDDPEKEFTLEINPSKKIQGGCVSDSL